MQVSPGTRLRMRILLLGFLAVSAAALEADAAPIVLKIDATLTDPDFAVSASDTDLNVAPGAEITLANGTNVGAFFFDDEFVDVSSNAALSFLQYRIQGGGGAHPLDSEYSLTGWGPLATLVFSNLELDVPGVFTGVTLAVDAAGSQPSVIGLGGGALVSGVDYLFNPGAESLTIYLAGLGVLDATGAPALGGLRFTLDLEASGPEPPAAIPEPASLTLVGSGIAAAAGAARRAREKRRKTR